MLEETLKVIPFSNSTEVIESLKAELPAYLASAVDTNDEIGPLEWWKRNDSTFPNWSCAARLIQPSSALAERAFSIFNERQDSALEDYIECSIMLQFNKC